MKSIFTTLVLVLITCPSTFAFNEDVNAILAKNVGTLAGKTEDGSKCGINIVNINEEQNNAFIVKPFERSVFNSTWYLSNNNFRVAENGSETRLDHSNHGVDVKSAGRGIKLSTQVNLVLDQENKKIKAIKMSRNNKSSTCYLE